MSTAFTRNTVWLAFFAAVLAAWVYMFQMVAMSGVDWTGRPATTGMAGMNMAAGTVYNGLAVMWAIMMAAMMLPTIVPTLRAYDDLIRSANGTRSGWVGVLAGYFAVWVGFALGIAALQIGLMRAGVLDHLGTSVSLWMTAALLIGVGAFQFTRMKEICHGVCHSPMGYYLGHWRAGTVGGFRMGLGLGAYCVGCCWGFMALGFVGGVMSLLWMGLATLFMVFEKLPQIGHYLLKPAGVALIGAGVLVAFRAGGII
jgi:predicted metal-binding membrane protein